MEILILYRCIDGEFFEILFDFFLASLNLVSIELAVRLKPNLSDGCFGVIVLKLAVDVAPVNFGQFKLGAGHPGDLFKLNIDVLQLGVLGQLDPVAN